MDPRIVERIARSVGVRDLAQQLAEGIGSSDLQSLLLEVFKRRASTVKPAGLLKSYRQNRFVRPSTVDPLAFSRFDAWAFELLPGGFDCLELSPLAPFGCCASLAPVSQHNVVSATRGTELVADATSVLALECAVRRRELLTADVRSRERVRLAASHRHARSQSFDDPKYTAHFRVFCLATAGRDQGELRFETESLTEHIGFHLSLLRKVMQQERVRLQPRVRITVRGAGPVAPAWQELVDELACTHSGTPVVLDRTRAAAERYYDGVCFNIGVEDDATVYDYLVDGGLTDWTKKLLNNRKERLMTSGIGSELLLKVLRRDGSRPR